METTMTTYTVNLTAKQYEALKDCDADGWQDYYYHWEDCTDEEMASECEACDCTPAQMREQCQMAKVAKFEDDSLTLVAGSHLEGDIFHGLLMMRDYGRQDGHSAGLIRAAGNLLDAILKANPQAKEWFGSKFEY